MTATFKERKAALERKHLTSSALIKTVLLNQAEDISCIMRNTGFYFRNGVGQPFIQSESVDEHKKATYTIGLRGKNPDGTTFVAGRITFSNIRPGGAPFMERELPYEVDRQAEEALSMTISNRGDEAMEKTISRNVTVGTSETKAKEDKINWDVRISAGIEAGFESFGASFTASLNVETGVGGEHTKSNETGKEESIERSVEDSVTIPARQKIKVTGTVDKITMKQKYRTYYPIDYDVSIHVTNQNDAEMVRKWYVNAFQHLDFNGIDQLISAFLGYPRHDLLQVNPENIKELLANESENHADWILGDLERLSDPGRRMVTTRGEITYKDASDISIDLFKLGTYNEQGELVT